MTDTKDINVLRNEVREIQTALTELTFTNERNKVILKQSEENLRACYALVQRGEATLEEFDDFVTKLDDLRFSISETEKVIKCTRNLLNNKIEELNPLETAENKKNCNFYSCCYDRIYYYRLSCVQSGFADVRDILARSIRMDSRNYICTINDNLLISICIFNFFDRTRKTEEEIAVLRSALTEWYS